MKKQYKVIVGVLIGIILLITIIKVFNIKQIILQKIYPKKYSEYVEKYAQEFNVDPLLIFSMIKAESNFKEKAKSSSGAKGLMQLMEATANEIADKIDTLNGSIVTEEKDEYHRICRLLVGMQKLPVFKVEV